MIQTFILLIALLPSCIHASVKIHPWKDKPIFIKLELMDAQKPYTVHQAVNFKFEPIYPQTHIHITRKMIQEYLHETHPDFPELTDEDLDRILKNQQYDGCRSRIPRGNQYMQSTVARDTSSLNWFGKFKG